MTPRRIFATKLGVVSIAFAMCILQPQRAEADGAFVLIALGSLAGLGSVASGIGGAVTCSQVSTAHEEGQEVSIALEDSTRGFAYANLVLGTLSGIGTLTTLGLAISIDDPGIRAFFLGFGLGGLALTSAQLAVGAWGLSLANEAAERRVLFSVLPVPIVTSNEMTLGVGVSIVHF